MAPKFVILALVFFAMVCMASAIDPTAALKGAANAPIPVENNNIIGTVNGSGENGAVAAAPVGGPISGHTFPSINLPPAANGVTTSIPDVTTIATTIILAAIAASLSS